jgi:hypothetical protein
MEAKSLKETAVFVCSHVFENSKSVNLIIRADGDLQLLCGGSHPGNEIPHVICLEHLLERDSSLVEAVKIPNGYQAERDQPGDRWRKKPC